MVETDSTTPELVDDFIVSVNNGFFHRDCIITVSTEAAATGLEILFITYSIDGGSCQFIGPTALARLDPIIEARTVVGVIELGPGWHTIQPCISVQGIEGEGAISRRCLIVECRTR